MADRADVHIRDLRSFLAVADELSFTRAAEALFVSQPALSKQVRALETRLNAELFTRGHRSVALTEAGTALLAPARRIVAEWDSAVAEVQAAAVAARQTLVVGFHTRIGRGLVPTRRSSPCPPPPDRCGSSGWPPTTAALRRGSTVATTWSACRCRTCRPAGWP
ncbi:MAG TPA: LysR family transcriptional regulator [Pseudonocardia sp.]|nr:LysR family transcriptional regulator [Pseudonocardia sp.]